MSSATSNTESFSQFSMLLNGSTNAKIRPRAHTDKSQFRIDSPIRINHKRNAIYEAFYKDIPTSWMMSSERLMAEYYGIPNPPNQSSVLKQLIDSLALQFGTAVLNAMTSDFATLDRQIQNPFARMWDIELKGMVIAKATHLYNIGYHDTALDAIVDVIDDLLRNKQFALIDSILIEAEPSELPTDIVLALLSTTNLARNSLSHFETFYKASITSLSSRPGFDKRAIMWYQMTPNK